MTRRISIMISERIVRLGGISQEKLNVISYGMELIISSIIGIFLLIGISIGFGQPFSWLAFLLGFVPLRVSAGGFHAKTHLLCYITIGGLFAACHLIAVGINLSPFFHIIVSMIAAVFVFLFAPIQSPQKPLTRHSRKTNRIASLVVVCIDIAIAIASFGSVIAIIPLHLHLFFLGNATSCLLLVVATIYQRKGGHSNEDQAA